MNIPYVNIHSHTNIYEENIIKLVSLFPDKQYFVEGVKYSVGIHPWDVESYEAKLKLIEQSVHKNEILAIGEIGIDKVCKTDLDLQIKVFKLQLEIAKVHNLPIVIHCVRCYNEVYKILVAEKFKLPIIFHGFNKEVNVAEMFNTFDAYFSFGKILKAKNIKVVNRFKDIPLNRIFLETDDEDIDIESIYEKAANIKGVSLETLKGSIYNNFCKIFIKEGIYSI